MKQLEQAEGSFPLWHISVNQIDETVQPSTVGSIPSHERLDQIACQLSHPSYDQEPTNFSSSNHPEHMLAPLADQTTVPQNVVPPRIVNDVIHRLAQVNSCSSLEPITNAVLNSVPTIVDRLLLERPESHPILSDEFFDVFNSQYLELDTLFPSSVNGFDIGDIEVGGNSQAEGSQLFFS